MVTDQRRRPLPDRLGADGPGARTTAAGRQLWTLPDVSGFAQQPLVANHALVKVFDPDDDAVHARKCDS